MKRLQEILDNVEAADESVLRARLDFVLDRMKEEFDRGKSADTRATVFVAIFGVFAGLVVQAATQIQAICQTNRLILYILLCGSFLFLARGIYYSIRILSVTKQYRLTPDYIVEGRENDIVETLRIGIAGVIWQYEQLIRPNTTKLFWLNRAQRNGMIAVILFALYSFLFYFLRETPFSISAKIALGVILVLVILFFFNDRFVERFGMWRR